MANISMDTIKELRERTGIGIMECKKALQEADGDMDKAIRLLKEKGTAVAAKKSERTVKEGSIGFCVNDDKTQIACIELQCETDFVAKNVDTLLNTKGENGETIQAMINEGMQKWGEKTVLAEVKVMKTDGFFGSYVHFNNKLVTIVEFDVKLMLNLKENV